MALQYNNPDSAILIAKSITCGVPQRGGFQQNTALRSVGFFIPPKHSSINLIFAMTAHRSALSFSL
jgi:hypothetical protein